MKGVAKKLETAMDRNDGSFQAMGTIVSVEGPFFVVRTDRGDLRCRRAVSCLVEPKVDDYVLVAARATDAPRLAPAPVVASVAPAYVLAVLERESADATLTAEGNLDLKLSHGKLRMAAAEGIDLVSSKHVQVGAAHFGVHATTAKLVAQEILAFGAHALGEIAAIRLKGGIMDKVFERVSERVQRSYRRVDEIDQLKAKQIDYVADETMSMRSENMVATAKELVKVDGEQIHFG
ncbi:MAG: DUF3540 domain-containing protein [Polyangiaceae bacterium]